MALERDGDVPADIARDALYHRTTTALETIRTLQAISRQGLFPLLREIPPQAKSDALSWHNLILMRNRMIHEWWTIDESIVRAAVRDDFPVIGELAASVHILAVPQDDPGSAQAAALAEIADPRLLRDVIYQDRTGRLHRLNL